MHRIFFSLIFLIALFSGSVSAQTVALSNDSNFITASMIIVSPSNVPQGSFGHAFIRMECPAHNLDRGFSFENNSEDNYVKLYLEGAKGRVNEVYFDQYLNMFAQEGRQVRSYPLNLTVDEKARLWEVLDSLNTLPERPFDVIDSHCFSVISEAVAIAVRPSKINWDEPPLLSNSYGKNSRLLAEGHSPWNSMIIMLPLANLGDRSGHGRKFVYPTCFDSIYTQLQIVAPDGSRRPLVKGEPEILAEQTNLDLLRPVHPTPFEVSLIVLGVILVVTALQFFLKWKIIGMVIDIILWVFVTGGGIALAVITYSPNHAGGDWNWIFIVLNPLAWIPVLSCRALKPLNRLKALKWVWTVYAAVLLIYAAAVTLVAPSTIAAWRVLACALAVRCLWHAYKMAINVGKRS